MRFSSFLVSLHTLLRASATASDPCEELCQSDGPAFCTKGSRSMIDHMGRQVCSNYYLRLDETYVYSAAKLPFRPLLVADVPMQLALNDMGLSKRMIYDPVKEFIPSLDYRRSYFDWDDVILRLFSVVRNEAADRPPMTLWRDIDGPRLLEIVSKVLNAPWYRDPRAVMLPFVFASAARIEPGTELQFAQESGLHEFCTSHHSWIAKCLQNLRRPIEIRIPLFKTLSSAHLFCPQLMSDPWVSAALLSVNLQNVQDIPELTVEVSGEENWFPQSTSWILRAYWNQLRKVPIEIKGEFEKTPASDRMHWFTKMGLEISQDTDLMTFTDDAGTLASKWTKFVAFGRFLGLIVLNAVPAPIGPIPKELLHALLGQRSSGNFARIASAFHSVVPATILRDFIDQPAALERLLTGLPDAEIVAALRENVETSPFLESNGRSLDLQRLWDQLNGLPVGYVRKFLFKISGLSAIPLDGITDASFFPIEVVEARDETISVYAPYGGLRGISIPFNSFTTDEQFRDALVRFIHSDA